MSMVALPEDWREALLLGRLQNVGRADAHPVR